MRVLNACVREIGYSSLGLSRVFVSKELRHDLMPPEGRRLAQDAILHAQYKLEQKHRKDHVRETRHFETLRDELVRNLERDLRDEMKLAVEALNASIKSGMLHLLSDLYLTMKCIRLNYTLMTGSPIKMKQMLVLKMT